MALHEDPEEYDVYIPCYQEKETLKERKESGENTTRRGGNKKITAELTKDIGNDETVSYYERVLKRAHRLGNMMKQNTRILLSLTPFEYAFLLCEEERLQLDRKEVLRRMFDYYMYGCVLGNERRKFVEWGYIKKAFILERARKKLKAAKYGVRGLIRLIPDEDDPMIDREIEEELMKEFNLIEGNDVEGKADATRQGGIKKRDFKPRV